MKFTKEICPEPYMIRKYYDRDLEEDELREIEEHFAYCDKCLDMHDYYGDFIKEISLSAVVQKELLKNSNTDFFCVAAADDYNKKTVSEMESKNGKYILKLIPYLDETEKSLLEIIITDRNVKGSVRVDLLDSSGIVKIGVQPIDEDSRVGFEVDSNIDVRNIMITIV